MITSVQFILCLENNWLYQVIHFFNCFFQNLFHLSKFTENLSPWLVSLTLPGCNEARRNSTEDIMT